MVNVDFGPGTVLGLGLIAGGYLLVQARALKPELSRDLDIFLSSVVMMSGGILVFQGWRLDPILFFAQASVVAVAITFALEAFKLREVEFMQEEQERKRSARSRRRTATGGARALPEDDGGGFGEYFDADASAPSWRGRRAFEYEGDAGRAWADAAGSPPSAPAWEGRDGAADGGDDEDTGFGLGGEDADEEEEFWSRFEDGDRGDWEE